MEQSANAARNAQKAKYQGMLSLYLNVIYQIIKNMCISTPAMMTLIYRIILAGIVALIGWDLFTEKKLTLQLNAAMVLIPLVLRVLMIK